MSENREIVDYLKDAIDAMNKAQQFVFGMTYAEFCVDDKTIFLLCGHLRS